MARKNARAKRKCESKTSFDTQTGAVKAIKSFIRKNGRPSALKSYKCSVCKRWHLATNIGGNRRKF